MGTGLIVTRAEHVLTIELDRPEQMNALTPEMFTELASILHAAQADEEVRVVVLAGRGRAFCSGMDMGAQAAAAAQAGTQTELRQRAEQRILDLAVPLIRALLGLHKPLIAQVGGVAAGAGVSLALLCDVRVAADTASFANVFLRRALVPDLGLTYLLPAAIGYSRAFEATLTGARIGAAEALRLGLVNQVVPAAELPGAVARIAAPMVAAAPLAAAFTKQLLGARREADLLEAVHKEAAIQGRCTTTEDYREGIAAFQEKREPRFAGR